MTRLNISCALGINENTVSRYKTRLNQKSGFHIADESAVLSRKDDHLEHALRPRGGSCRVALPVRRKQSDKLSKAALEFRPFFFVQGLMAE